MRLGVYSALIFGVLQKVAWIFALEFKTPTFYSILDLFSRSANIGNYLFPQQTKEHKEKSASKLTLFVSLNIRF